jgi:6-phosphogluconolactonase (cycloisomerase 2 family)
LRSTYVFVLFSQKCELTRSVQYRGGTLVRHPLLPSGLFSFPSPLPNHIHRFDYPFSTPPHSRQDSSHPHQIIPISQDGKTFLITDLGTDRLVELRWEGDEESGSWKELRQYSVEAQNGPRHGVKQGAFSSFLFFSILPPFRPLSHLQFSLSLCPFVP